VNALNALLAKVNRDDRVLIFVATHGFKAKMDDGVYLAIEKSKRADISRDGKTGVSLLKVRQLLDSCQAKSKLLILDCCHAGGARGTGDDPGDVRLIFRGSSASVMASCGESEQSWQHPVEKMGVFTFWLVQALQGGADANNDGEVTPGEVFDYVVPLVTSSVMAYHGRGVEQKPVSYLDSHEAIATLVPVAHRTSVVRLARELDYQIRLQRIEWPELKRVAMLPIVRVTGDHVVLPRENTAIQTPTLLLEELTRLAGDDYFVIDTQTTGVRARGVRVEEMITEGTAKEKKVETSRALSSLRAIADVVILGLLYEEPSFSESFTVELRTTNDNKLLARPSCRYLLSEDNMGDRGHSFDNRNRPAGSPHSPAVMNHVTEKSKEASPLSALSNKLPVTLGVERRRDGRFVEVVPSTNAAGKLFYRFQIDDVIRITVSNDHPDRLAMTLLVDGVNTLGAKIEPLGAARSWVLEPHQSYVVDGWHELDEGEKPGVRTAEGIVTANRTEFVVVESGQSVAERAGFADQLGLITAAFYYERGKGIGAGNLERRDLRTVDFEAGRLMAALNLCYVVEPK
jgi:hypothetical protein